MAREFGEGFRQPLDYETGRPIPGAPRIGAPTTNRPLRVGTSGYVVLRDEDDAPAPESIPPAGTPPLVRDHDNDGM